MKRNRLTAGLALVVMLVAATSAIAEPTKFTLDPAHSRAEFKVRHLFTKVPGVFNTLEGTLLFDGATLANSSVDVTIDANSVSTSNDKRDNHLRTEDFFWVEKYPTLTFKSKEVIPGEGGHFKVIGDLTIRGVTKEVTLDAEQLGVQDFGEMLGTRAGFEANTRINRKDFGLNWNKTLDQGTLLGDDVDISLSVEAVHRPDR